MEQRSEFRGRVKWIGAWALIIGLIYSFTAAVEGKGFKVREQVLIVGVAAHLQPAWSDFFLFEEIPYRFEKRTRTYYVNSNPLPILKTAQTYRVLAQSVRRATLERELEKEFTRQWPRVSIPRVCVAFPDGHLGPVEGQEAIAMVIAQGLDPSEELAVKQLIADHVPEISPDRVVVIGMSGSLRPPYHRSTDRPSLLARLRS